MRLSNRKFLVLVVAVSLAATACGGHDHDGDKDKATGTFPSFYKLAKETLPLTGESGDSLVMRTSLIGDGPNLGAAATFPSSYNTSSSDFDSAFATSSNAIGQVMYDAGPDGTVKSLFTVLSHVDSTMELINSTYSDADGNVDNCTAISASTAVTVPFFATNAPLNDWDDSGKYQCYVEDDGSMIVFGRHAIASPSAGCSDAFEYYVVDAGGAEDKANTSETATRGTSLDLASVKKFYYNGCSKELKVAYFQTTQYSGGPEFTSRTEFTGNADSRTFTLRSAFFDIGVNSDGSIYGTFASIAGTGTSKKAATADSAVNFTMGYVTQNCTGTNYRTCTDAAPTASGPQTFCVKNDTTAFGYELDTTTANCSALATDYAAIDTLEAATDLPYGYFATDAAAFGL